MKRYLSLIIAILAIQTNLFAAEAGMPQLDPTYWASQAFWLILVFSILHISIAKFYLPKIKKNLDDRENKIKEDLDEANNLKILSEKKLKDYDIILEDSKKEVAKILLDSKNIGIKKPFELVILQGVSGEFLTEKYRKIFNIREARLNPKNPDSFTAVQIRSPASSESLPGSKKEIVILSFLLSLITSIVWVSVGSVIKSYNEH
jgi:hypothetical protein